MADPKGAKSGEGPVVIKKYANRRLYNTASSTYVTLEHLADMVRKGVDFVVYDAKSGDDITRSVLAQIIFDEESRSESLLPIQFLRQLIGFYGNSMQAFLPSYLEMSLASFAEQQERLRQQFSGMGPAPSLSVYEDQVKKNIALFSQAMQMFSPFAYPRPDAPAAGGTPSAAPQSGSPSTVAAAPEPAPPAAPRGPVDGGDDAIADLKRRMEEMAAQIDRLASGR
ncbi:polyhydroxyalkanoate synthesis repressor PhaR [Phenylobacterium parvum]|uniref:Polyhydroxyalkanoate synthesis repressor PhaR n=1 Tax=Phenylobacterium parvum TaxID=2201350 RepID=A0A2Z3I3U9_9CAUL|nr:polyhydroxyalkanoate synthesis repressor PhaR [Phenylobacterium parvum]AWM78358.1 polyhydroxyalkanoate synthesis repressor PhaR [Phenylobacterium parvum]